MPELLELVVYMSRNYREQVLQQVVANKVISRSGQTPP